MSESKMLKAKCRKTGKHFAMELKEYGSEWKVVNFIDLTDDAAGIVMSEVKQSSFRTNKNLLACLSCGGRVVGGCSCARQGCSCSSDMKYKYNCIYCDQLEIDYSRGSSMRTPYTKWAGMSNIPEAIKDKYGNPQGSQYDLVEDGSFQGYKIVVLNLCDECYFDQPKIALEKKGFEVVEYVTLPPIFSLMLALRSDKSQLWIISDRKSYMNDSYISFIQDYFNSGHGVYIWGDNDPYYQDANLILGAIFGVSMSGNSRGDRVIGIQSAPRTPGIVPNHPITTGIVNFYEGITIAEINTGQKLIPLVYASDGKIVTAYYDRDSKRALADGGFTRLCHKWDSAGTDRYVVNAAAWLANIEKFGYDQ